MLLFKHISRPPVGRVHRFHLAAPLAIAARCFNLARPLAIAARRLNMAAPLAIAALLLGQTAQAHVLHAHHRHHWHHWHAHHLIWHHHIRGTALAPSGVRQARYKEDVVQAAKRNHVDPALLRAVITVESGFNRHAVSHAGAVGLMQLLPATARRFGARNVYDPKQNIAAGARYLHHLLHTFDKNVRLALAAYNAGAGAVIQHGYRIPPYRETVAYVPRVMTLYREYRKAHNWG